MTRTIKSHPGVVEITEGDTNVTIFLSSRGANGTEARFNVAAGSHSVQAAVRTLRKQEAIDFAISGLEDGSLLKIARDAARRNAEEYTRKAASFAASASSLLSFLNATE